jgi:N-acetylglucosaminyldiphosphoundecaprenol N-acetyl-beta-D-mannosaminyltransferase
VFVDNSEFLCFNHRLVFFVSIFHEIMNCHNLILQINFYNRIKYFHSRKKVSMDIFGICIKPLKKIDLFKEITNFSTQKTVFTPNPEILLRVKKDSSFRDILQQASFLTSDGIGLFIAYQILDSKLPLLLNIGALPYYFFNLFLRKKYLYQKYGERITGNDLTKELLIWCEKENISIMVSDLYNPSDLGKLRSQDSFLTSMRKVYPLLKVDFFVWNPGEKEQIIKNMQSSQAKILFSTLGMKAQEENVIEIMKLCPQIKLGL